MEFKIAKEEFTSGLFRIQSIIEKRTTLPILTHAMIETKTDAIQIVATDLEVGMKGTYDAEIVSEGAVAVPAAHLFAIVRELPEGEVTFKVVENDQVIIECGRARFRISATGVEEFPNLPDYQKEKFITL